MCPRGKATRVNCHPDRVDAARPEQHQRFGCRESGWHAASAGHALRDAHPTGRWRGGDQHQPDLSPPGLPGPKLISEALADIFNKAAKRDPGR